MNIKLKKAGSETVIYAGEFSSIKSCVEAAIRDNLCLDYVDLRGANLMNAELDDAQMRYARFDQANLSGANMSSGHFDGASFRGALLCNVCLCESVLRQCQFFDAALDGCDLAWADISGSAFDGLGSLNLNFSDVLLMNDTKYYDHTGVVCGMSRPPMVLRGLRYCVAFFDDHLKIGGAALPYHVWARMSDHDIRAAFGGDVVQFLAAYRDVFFELLRKRNHIEPEIISSKAGASRGN